MRQRLRCEDNISGKGFLVSRDEYLYQKRDKKQPFGEATGPRNIYN